MAQEGVMTTMNKNGKHVVMADEAVVPGVQQ